MRISGAAGKPLAHEGSLAEGRMFCLPVVHPAANRLKSAGVVPPPVASASESVPAV
jgi:hypothetical protein